MIRRRRARCTALSTPRNETIFYRDGWGFVFPVQGVDGGDGRREGKHCARVIVANELFSTTRTVPHDDNEAILITNDADERARKN